MPAPRFFGAAAAADRPPGCDTGHRSDDAARRSALACRRKPRHRMRLSLVITHWCIDWCFAPPGIGCRVLLRSLAQKQTRRDLQSGPGDNSALQDDFSKHDTKQLLHM